MLTPETSWEKLLPLKYSRNILYSVEQKLCNSLNTYSNVGGCKGGRNIFFRNVYTQHEFSLMFKNISVPNANTYLRNNSLQIHIKGHDLFIHSFE